MNLDTLKRKYINLNLALELDDVDSSLSTMYHRTNAIADIQEKIDEETLKEWHKEINKILSDNKIRCCSGGLYNAN